MIAYTEMCIIVLRDKITSESHLSKTQELDISGLTRTGNQITRIKGILRGFMAAAEHQTYRSPLLVVGSLNCTVHPH